ncbi:MAG: ABC transporter ATP-binding protein [Acidimicrobiales bacterium]
MTKGSVGRLLRQRIAFLNWGLNLRPVRLAIIGGMTCSLMRATLQWVVPLPLKLLFDNVLTNHPLPAMLAWLPANRAELLYIFCGTMIVIAILLGLTSYGANALLAGAGQRVVFDLRCRLFRHLEAQSSRFHQRHPVGDLLARLGGDVQAMQSVVVNVFPVAMENGLTVAGMVVIMLVLDWQFSLLALALLPGLYWVIHHYLGAIKTAQRGARRHEGLATASAQQTLVALPVVQAFGTEGLEADRYAALAQQGLTANRRSVLLQSRFTPMVTVLMTISTAMVMFFGSRQVISGRLTPGDLLVFSAYFRGMYSPARQLSKLAGTMGRGQASAERVTEMLSIDEQVPQRPLALTPHKVFGSIVFDSVSFSHPGSGMVLEEINLTIGAGKQHALVGPTGSGKSTLLRLVARFADPGAGAVLLDGVNLVDLDLEWLRRQIAFVPQEMALLRPTVWENIAYGSAGASRTDAIAAARTVGVHEVLDSLREGYDTDVGERGDGLSGGQRQCVAMARAMVRNAPILLLDEPTTGLDSATESVVIQALGRLCEGRTTLMVSHQLSAVSGADRITVLSRGRIVEDGTHDELSRVGTSYSRLHQLSGTSGESGARPQPPITLAQYLHEYVEMPIDTDSTNRADACRA